MSYRKLTILGIIAVLLVIWAAVQSHFSNRPRTVSDGLTYLVQGLDPADVGSIVIGAGEDAVTLKRRGRQFVVVEKDYYPAKLSEISSLISKCLEIQRSEFVTDKPSNHEALEVTEEKARSVVKFMTPEPNSLLLAGVAVGKTEELGQGTYVRLLSSDDALSNKVYVASSVPWFGGEAMNYLEQELISVKREDIESVIVSSPKGKYTLRTKEDSQDIVLENLPAGKQLKSSDSQSVFTALTGLRFDDVRKDSGELTFDREYVCRLKDSTVYTVRTAQKDDKTYASLAAEFTDKTPVEKKDLTQGGTVESEEELKKKEAKLLALENVAKLAARHQGWVYEIAEWKAKNLTKELSDLIEDEEKPKDAEQTEDPNAVDAGEPARLNPDEPEAAQELAVTEFAEPNAVQKAEEPNETKVRDPNAARPE